MSMTEEDTVRVKAALRAVRQVGAVNMLDKRGVEHVLLQVASVDTPEEQGEGSMWMLAHSLLTSMSSTEYVKILMSGLGEPT